MIGVVQAVAKGGCGIVRCNDQTVFIPGVIRGETVEFALQGKHKGIWQGELQRIIEPSAHRLEAPCRHFRDCGGCNLQHMTYAEQLRCKEEILFANIHKIAGIKPGGPVSVLSSPPFRYRSKMELQVQNGRSGFFRIRSHQLVVISQCLLLGAAAERVALELPALQPGTDGILQILDNGTDQAARLQERSGKVRWLLPRRKLIFALPPYRFGYGPEHFIQSNLYLMPAMQELLITHLPAGPRTAAADLFCGSGFFTLPLARHYQRVLALESDTENVRALRANLEMNRIRNVEVRPGNALTAELPPLDLVVLDPPRGGLAAATIARIAGAGAQKVIYYSCDSATFARDLRLFQKQGYGLQNLKLIDNFPQTDHFEIFSVLGK